VFLLKKISDYHPGKSAIQVDAKPVVAKKGQELTSVGAQWCTIVCLEGFINNEEYIGMAHIMSDISELEQLIKAFDRPSHGAVIGGSDEWFSKPTFEEIVTQLKAIIKVPLLIVFNPTESDLNKGVDVSINQHGECIYSLREMSSLSASM
jgi:hypothetical protein